MIPSVCLLSLCKQTSMNAYFSFHFCTTFQKRFFYYRDSYKTGNPSVPDAGMGYEKVKAKRPMRARSRYHNIKDGEIVNKVGPQAGLIYPDLFPKVDSIGDILGWAPGVDPGVDPQGKPIGWMPRVDLQDGSQGCTPRSKELNTWSVLLSSIRIIFC